MRKLITIAVMILFCQQLIAKAMDRIVAIVEDDVILYSELNREMETVMSKISAADPNKPPESFIQKQVLERLIINKIQRQIAERSGIRVNNEMLNQAIKDIAKRNNMTIQQFQEELSKQNISYPSFSESVRSEIIVNQLRAREIGERVKVTDREVTHFLETQGDVERNKSQYHLGHILIALPKGASSKEIQAARTKAEGLVVKLRKGEGFNQVAIESSDGGRALKGGDLGWRKLAEVPTIFTDDVTKLDEGDIAEPIRSPSGFHIIKMLGLKGIKKHVLQQTKVRHILLKTNEMLTDNEARVLLFKLLARIKAGEPFEKLARAYSNDKVSALNGGNLDWVNPGALVPPFEQAMGRLKINELSEPVQTQFGWHIIQVLGRKTTDNSKDFKVELAREEIRKRKIEEETEAWLRKLRDEAYVEIRLR